MYNTNNTNGQNQFVDSNLEFLDIISVISFYMAVQNYELNSKQITNNHMDEHMATLMSHVTEQIDTLQNDIAELKQIILENKK